MPRLSNISKGELSLPLGAETIAPGKSILVEEEHLKIPGIQCWIKDGLAVIEESKAKPPSSKSKKSEE